MYTQKQTSKPVLITFLLGFVGLGLPTLSFALEGNTRIIATGGVHQVEGAAGGGLVPWAVIAGYGQSGEFGFSGFSSAVEVDDYTYTSGGFALSFSDRIELSFARQSLDISELSQLAGLADDKLTTDVIGLKVRLFNNLIYDPWPQISLGVQHKKVKDFDVPQIAGALDDSDTDVYLSATKLWLNGVAGYPILVNATFRSTSANQLGLLGFGGDLNDDKEIQIETSAAILFRRNLAVGFEYRQKPDNLSFAEEEAWSDIFVAWFPSKNISVTAAVVDLGTIGLFEKQNGFYLSIQGAL
ncbi:DUF3034 family protein [Aurantivibrio infirmus]